MWSRYKYIIRFDTKIQRRRVKFSDDDYVLAAVSATATTHLIIQNKLLTTPLLDVCKGLFFVMVRLPNTDADADADADAAANVPNLKNYA